uniref:BPTI/Kunitz inhibitor domain-containing protein n=1 Tax=Strigamia maritima TaxID=126957 RepID=T1J3U9_STRMM
MKFLLTLLGLISLVQGDLEANNDFICKFGGKEYSLGEKIETPETACFVCTCHRNFAEPSASPPNSCAIIDCPWGYYSSKPHCTTQYMEGKCCPELRCSAPHPRTDASFLSRKRADESTDGYEITAKVESELTIYCTTDSTSDDLSQKEIEWKHQTSDGAEVTVANTTQTQIAFFPPGAWALYFPSLKASDEGLYTCHIPTTPVQTQTTRVIVRTGPRPPLVDPICYKPAFKNIENVPCSNVADNDLPWYYNTTTGDCAQHTEKSCKWGSENHFPSMSACWDHCLDDCYASSEPGPCDALIPKYYYSHQSDTCQAFTYGGCGGNLNKFDTVQECEDKYSAITCSYKSQTYNSGEVIEMPDECLSCTCNEKFNQGDKATHCKPLNCNIEEMDIKQEKGCLPIYEENKCCPVDWQCPPSLNTAYRQGGEETRPTTTDPHSQCHYGGQSYPLHFELLTGYKGGINCTCLTPPAFTCTVPSCPEPPSASDEMIRCNMVPNFLLTTVCPEYKCWNILEETDHVGQPRTIKEKEACGVNACVYAHECIVNYTKCHLEECVKECRECAVPMCQAWSKYVSPPNECPFCESLKTPEEACEMKPDFCPGDSRCEIFNPDKCRQGSCEPSCILPVIQPQLVVIEKTSDSD